MREVRPLSTDVTTPPSPHPRCLSSELMQRRTCNFASASLETTSSPLPADDSCKSANTSATPPIDRTNRRPKSRHAFKLSLRCTKLHRMLLVVYQALSSGEDHGPASAATVRRRFLDYVALGGHQNRHTKPPKSLRSACCIWRCNGLAKRIRCFGVRVFCSQ